NKDLYKVQQNSEFYHYFLLLRQFLTTPRTMIQHIENIQLRFALIIYYNFQLIYLICNIITMNLIQGNLIEFVKSSQYLAVYYPIIERYFSNPVFFTALLIFLQFILMPMILFASSFIQHFFKRINAYHLVKIYLITAALIPFLLIIPAFIVSYSALAIIYSIWINTQISSTFRMKMSKIEYAVILLLHLPIIVAYFLL
ncbi:MAG: hypothetical protein KDD94_04595, partial [Calditrichaeota bacterium]|nr:hypothetical protein [Calditrichota bacterium]